MKSRHIVPLATSTHEPHMPEFDGHIRETHEILLDELGYASTRIVRIDESFEHLVEMFVGELIEHASFGRSNGIHAAL